MDKNYWKEAYKALWDSSSQREKRLAAYIEKLCGLRVREQGLGTGSTEYISGTAEENGYQRGDADLHIEGTNIFIEVTGPLSERVKSTEPLWFRPDKIENAINNREHDTFMTHNCASDNTWRVIHIDERFIERYNAGEFTIVTPWIRGRLERYVEIEVADCCIRDLDYLISYISASYKCNC